MLKYFQSKKIENIGPVKFNPQIFDLLQLSRKEREVRTLSQKLIRQLYCWKRTARKNQNPSLKLYMEIEGILLRRRAQDAVLIYRLVKNDRIRAFNDYMEKLPPRNNNFSAVQ
jgi:hypothetical protein